MQVHILHLNFTVGNFLFINTGFYKILDDNTIY